jgi:Rieske Fe-S protein
MFVPDLAMARDSFSVKTSTPILGCPCHFSVFDIAQGGKVISGPAPKPPLQLTVRVADANAFINL